MAVDEGLQLSSALILNRQLCVHQNRYYIVKEHGYMGTYREILFLNSIYPPACNQGKFSFTLHEITNNAHAGRDTWLATVKTLWCIGGIVV